MSKPTESREHAEVVLRVVNALDASTSAPWAVDLLLTEQLAASDTVSIVTPDGAYTLTVLPGKAS